MYTREQHYIDGQWQHGAGGTVAEVREPSTGDVLGRVRLGTAADVETAVGAARAAQRAWAGTPVTERAGYLRAIADAMDGRSEEITELVIREVGTPRRLAGIMQFNSAVHALRDAADAVEAEEHEEQVANSVVRYGPAGVVGLITPWNYPLYQAALKVAPALAAGCTVVLKPSELASLSTLVLADVAAEVGLPAGVLNVVGGDGAEVGEALASHPDLDMVSFTGSVRAGRRVAEVAGRSLTKVALELGGKGADIILPGSDVVAAAKHAAASCFGNAGQTCAAMTRLIVPQEAVAAVEQAVLEAAEPYQPGDPLDAETWLGPVISAQQREKVRGYIDAGVSEGAQLLRGGTAPELVPDRGYYVPATVFTHVSRDMTIAREEIFGPVLVIMPVADAAEAVAVANDSDYGLTAAVWGPNEQSAWSVAEQLDVGSVTVNGGRFNPSAPFGGRKCSGFGRERGKYGLEEFRTTKAYHLPWSDQKGALVRTGRDVTEFVPQMPGKQGRALPGSSEGTS